MAISLNKGGNLSLSKTDPSLTRLLIGLGREYCQLVPLNDFYPTIDSRAVRIDIVGVVVKHERKLV